MCKSKISNPYTGFYNPSISLFYELHEVKKFKPPISLHQQPPDYGLHLPLKLRILGN